MNKQAQNSIAPGVLPGVRPDDLKNLHCKVCGPEVSLFMPLLQLKQASPLQTVHSQPMVINFPTGFICMKCGGVNTFTSVEKEKETPESNLVH